MRKINVTVQFDMWVNPACSYDERRAEALRTLKVMVENGTVSQHINAAAVDVWITEEMYKIAEMAARDDANVKVSFHPKQIKGIDGNPGVVTFEFSGFKDIGVIFTREDRYVTGYMDIEGKIHEFGSRSSPTEAVQEVYNLGNSWRIQKLRESFYNGDFPQ